MKLVGHGSFCSDACPETKRNVVCSVVTPYSKNRAIQYQYIMNQMRRNNWKQSMLKTGMMMEVRRMKETGIGSTKF